MSTVFAPGRPGGSADVLGQTAQQVVESLKAGDAEYSKRQCMVMDKNGDSAFIHGDDNIPYVGAIAYPTIAVAGNMLESDKVFRMVC